MLCNAATSPTGRGEAARSCQDQEGDRRGVETKGGSLQVGTRHLLLFRRGMQTLHLVSSSLHLASDLGGLALQILLLHNIIIGSVGCHYKVCTHSVISDVCLSVCLSM